MNDIEASLQGEHLKSDDLLRAVLLLKEEASLARISRLWIEQGIPFAYMDKPIAFEVVRDWLSKEFCVDPRDVALVGSARLGYSAEPKRYGAAFRPGFSSDHRT